jgi:hypothetical protein
MYNSFDAKVSKIVAQKIQGVFATWTVIANIPDH